MAPKGPEPVGIEDFCKGSQTEEGSERQGHFCPFAGFAADGEDGQPDEGGDQRSEDGEGEAFECAAEAEPGSEHGHELGVTEAHAFLAAD